MEKRKGHEVGGRQRKRRKKKLFFVEARMKKKLHDASSYIIFVLLANKYT